MQHVGNRLVGIIYNLNRNRRFQNEIHKMFQSQIQ